MNPTDKNPPQARDRQQPFKQTGKPGQTKPVVAAAENDRSMMNPRRPFAPTASGAQAVPKSAADPRGVPRHFKPAVQLHHFKPAVAQAKSAPARLNERQPIAPPVYRPHAKPSAVQQKTGLTSQMKTQPGAPPVYRVQTKAISAQAKMAKNEVNLRTRIAPAVTQPQPMLSVLKTKTSPNSGNLRIETPRQPVAGPVRSPGGDKIVQPKAISPRRVSPKAPAAYRPEQKQIAQPKTASAMLAHTLPITKPAHQIDTRLRIAGQAVSPSRKTPGGAVKAPAYMSRTIQAAGLRNLTENQASQIQKVVDRFKIHLDIGGSCADEKKRIPNDIDFIAPEEDEIKDVTDPFTKTVLTPDDIKKLWKALHSEVGGKCCTHMNSTSLWMHPTEGAEVGGQGRIRFMPHQPPQLLTIEG